jgi:hypothetical protein
VGYISERRDILAKGGDILAKGRDILAKGRNILAKGRDILTKGREPNPKHIVRHIQLHIFLGMPGIHPGMISFYDVRVDLQYR